METLKNLNDSIIRVTLINGVTIVESNKKIDCLDIHKITTALVWRAKLN